MRIVLTSHGSTGDIFPMIALGKGLQARGHHVRFATSPPFQEDVKRSGLVYEGVPPLWEREELAYWMGRLQRYSTPLYQLRELYRAALPHIPALIDAMDHILADADLLVSSYLFPMNRALAERHGVPFATFAFAHNTIPSSFYPPEGLPRLRGWPRPVQRFWNRSLWRLGNWVVDAVINQTILRKLKARGLPPVRDFFSRPANLVLVGVSRRLMKPPFTLHERFQFTGYCRWQNPPDEKLGHELEAFTGGRRVPILTFGSMVYSNPARTMQRFLANWPEGEPIILQRGWSGFELPAGYPYIKMVGSMCHDQLFRFGEMVIHHGGAGTTASVLHSGLPQIVVPHIADQNFFCQEVKRLGCGLGLEKRKWPERLYEMVQQVRVREGYHESARRAQSLLAEEDGPATAAELLEDYVARATPQG